MLAFIDESGRPHPNDPATHSVLAAVCYAQADARRISHHIIESKRKHLGDGRAHLELKAHDYLKEPTFRRRADLRDLVENVFDQLQGLPVTTLVVVMERPPSPITQPDNLPPREYRYIIRRIHDLAAEQDDMAIVLIDGDGNYGGLSRKLEHYLYRSEEGRALTSVTDTPYFVDSRLTIGIQLADMVAGAVRQFHQNNLQSITPSTPFQSAIARYYGVISEKTRNFMDSAGS